PMMVKAEKESPPAKLAPLTDAPPLALPAPADATPPPPLAGLPLPTMQPEIKRVSAEEPAPVPPPVPLATPTPPTGSEGRPIMIPSGALPPSFVPPSGTITPAVASVPAVSPPSPPAEVPPQSLVPRPVPSASPVATSSTATGATSSVIFFKVKTQGITFRTLAHRTLGNPNRWVEIARMNPTYGTDAVFEIGTTLTLPGDALVSEIEVGLTPLPSLRARPTPPPPSVLPLTGTYPVLLEGRTMTLPGPVLEQLARCNTVLVSPGSSRCLWITNQAHLDRLSVKLEKSLARESDVQAFRRLYFSQITHLPVREGRFTLTEKLAAFAGLENEVVLVGIDDHFEVWDAAMWRKFTSTRKTIGAE
ncbi:MAG: hypothetical protein EBV06_13165, partial [Planctomycetia bacterium]|nr:hypothetical protein [Planctomycetia bacterium]